MTIKPISILVVVTAVALATACTTKNPPKVADTIYKGGAIVTVNDAQPAAEAVAVKDGKILAVGNQVDVLKFKGDPTQLVDLGGTRP